MGAGLRTILGANLAPKLAFGANLAPDLMIFLKIVSR